MDSSVKLENNKVLSCNTVDELVRVARMPLSAFPTNQLALWNINFPLNNQDYQDLSGNEINLFGANQNLTNTVNNNRIAYSSNMSGPTITVDNPFIATGLCVVVQGEPMSVQIEGNQFGPKSYVAGLGNPASPLNLRNQTALLQALLGTAEDLPADFFACPSILDWGGPTWRFMWALMQAWRLVFQCPNSGFENIIDERLADIGNCCAHTSFQGFSNSDHPLMYLVRRINELLRTQTLPSSLTSPADAFQAFTESGYFFPLNAEQNSDGEISPYHYQKDSVSYGAPYMTTQCEKWIRLPIPMPLDSNTKIKLTMQRRKGDEDYWYRSLDEAIMRRCAGPVPEIASCNFPIHETDQSADPDGGIACQTIIPAGQVRVILGLKGFQVREGTCHLWRRVLQDKELLMQLLQGEYTPNAGMCGSPGGTVQGELIERYSNEPSLLKLVGVSAGMVGTPDNK